MRLRPLSKTEALARFDQLHELFVERMAAIDGILDDAESAPAFHSGLAAQIRDGAASINKSAVQMRNYLQRADAAIEGDKFAAAIECQSDAIDRFCDAVDGLLLAAE